MKERLISSAVGLSLLAVVVWQFEGLFLNAVLFVIGLLVSYEAVVSFTGRMNILLFFMSLVYFASTIFFETDFVYSSAFLIFSFAASATFSKDKFKIIRIFASALIMILFANCFRSIFVIRSESTNLQDGRFLLLFALGLAWIGDTFAFFIGRKFGKRKLCPDISPNKTIEGSVGGISFSVIILTLTYYIYTKTNSASIFTPYNDILHILTVAGIVLLGTLTGMTGDLVFSYIKRELE